METEEQKKKCYLFLLDPLTHKDNRQLCLLLASTQDYCQEEKTGDIRAREVTEFTKQI